MTKARCQRVAFQLSVALTALITLLSGGLVSAPEVGAQVSSLPLQFSDVAVFATNSVRVQNNAQVLSGHIVVNNASPGPTLTPGFELAINSNADTPAGYAIVGDSILVSTNAVVGGNAFFNNLSNSGTISGSQTTPLPPFPIFAPLPVFQPSTPGVLDVTVPSNMTQTLAPGNYRDITVLSNATLKLSPGVYNVRSIVTGTNGRVFFQNLASGTADVRVQNQVVTGSNSDVRSEDGDPLKAAKIIFYVGFASGPGLTPNAVTFGSNGTVHANVYAPNGTLRLNDNVNAAGAFLARDVDLGSNVQIDLETFFAQQAPTITSANATTFTVGQAGTFTVTTTGSPTPSITQGGAALPGGVTFNDNGDGTGTLSGTPAAGSGGSYAITFTASNTVPPDAVQNFTLTVNEAPAVTSANATTFTVGASGSFTVTTSGFPTPSITRGGAALPSGVTFADNGNGTAILSGTPAAGSGGVYAITFTATNAAGNSPAQTFTLTVNQGPVITSADATTFTVGQPGSFTVTTTGFPPASITQGGAALPSGVTFVSNGDGTATLSGTPAAGTGGAYAITFTATNAAGTSPTQNFTLTVAQAPAITSGNATTFTVGQPGSFTVTTTGFPPASITQGGAALPPGVTFVSNGDGTATLSGTPAAGTGGVYAITFTATNAAGSSPAQNFTLTVNEAPTITSANSTTFTVGQPGTFTVTTTGFPTPSIAQSGALPAGVTFANNGNGTATLSGTPAAGSGGVYPLTFTASNGVLPNAVQPFTLGVNAPPTAVDDGPYLADANTTFSRATTDSDDLLDNDSLGLPAATLTSFGGGSLGGTVTSNAAGSTVNFGTGGSLTVQSNGEFTFTPETGFTGAFTFQYRLTNSGGTSDATVTIHVRPKAVGDIFPENVIGNVIVNTATGIVFSVLTNDVFNGPVNAVAVGGTSANGGTVTLNVGTGTFTYNPPVGFQGVDTFAYTITDTSGFTSAPAAVAVSVTGRIWFVNNNSGACPSSCNGRLTNPFTTLDAFTSVNDGVGVHPGNNDSVFVYESATAYTFMSGTLLRPGQTLVGQDATASLASIAGVTLPSGSSLPAMNTGGNATTIGSTVTLAAGSTVRGLSIATGSAAGLNGGAVTGVSVSEVNATTTTGIAVNLNGTGGTVSLTSVSASGGTNGIVLQNTTGSFTVTGDGASTAVGGNGSGGTIANMFGADGTTAGIGVYLDNAQNVALRRMIISGTHQNFGIRGLNVGGFALEYSTVSGSFGTSVAAGEGSVSFGTRTGITGLTGVATITNSLIRDGVADNLGVFNHAGTLDLTISGSTIRNSGAVAGNDGVIVEANGTATVSVDVKNSTFAAHRGDHFQAAANGSGVLNVKFGTDGGNTLSGGHASPLGQGVIINSGVFSGQVTFDVSNNALNGAIDTPINVNKGGGTGTFSGRIHNNAIGTSGVANSGTTGNKDAIRAVTNGAGSLTALISNNVLREVSGNGIFGISRDGSSNLDLTVVGNSLSEPNPGNNAIRVEAGALSGDSGDVCADVGGAGAAANTVSGDWGAAIGADEMRLRHQFSATTVFRLPGFAGPSPAGVPAYLIGRNTGFPPGTVSATIAGGGAYTGGGPCAQPAP